MICPFCKTEIPDGANNCPHCTQSLVFSKHPTSTFLILGMATAGMSIWTFWFPPLAIVFLVVGGFFIIIGILSIFTKLINKPNKNPTTKSK